MLQCEPLKQNMGDPALSIQLRSPSRPLPLALTSLQGSFLLTSFGLADLLDPGLMTEARETGLGWCVKEL